MTLNFETKMNVQELAAPLSPTDSFQIVSDLRSKNQNEDPERITKPQMWNINEFDKPHHPVFIGSLCNVKIFSAYDESKRIRVLDMALYMPDQGWHVPLFLNQFEEAMCMAVRAEKAVNPNADDRFVYITIDQKTVKPDKPGRRLGLHSDVGLTDEKGQQIDVTAENKRYIAAKTGISDHAYIIHDILPTEFYPGPFPLANNGHVQSFEEMKGDQQPVTYDNYSMLRLNAYDIHTSVRNDTGAPIQRTFFKMQFTEQKLERDINTVNPYFDYS